MAIATAYQRSGVGRSFQSPRREVRNPGPRSSDGIDSQPSLSDPWNGISSHDGSTHRPSFPHEPILGSRSPMSTGSFSPTSFKEDSILPAQVSLCLRVATKGPLERQLDDDGISYDDASTSLPGIQSLLSHHESYWDSHPASPLWKPSPTPESSEGDNYSRRSSAFGAQDLITEKLNGLRTKKNKESLPPLGAFCNSGFTNQPTQQLAPLYQSHSEPCPPPSPSREVRRRRARSPEATHCNIKYLIEELDFIRYQRVDYGQKWALVESNFRAMFPMTMFPVKRKTQGLQGVCYRQNKLLPHIRNDKLVIMENGHVEPACVKTKGQSDRKYLYTLVYLYPDRAMNYSWVSMADRQRARQLNQIRQRQLAKGRLRAIERGTYIEKLPANVDCGCCPGEDRERDPERRSDNKPRVAKVKPSIRPRL